MGTSAAAILEYLASWNPDHKLNGEEGVLHAGADVDIRGLLVSWMPTVSAIRRAIREGCQMIVCHEALTFHDYFPNASTPDPWTADRARLALLREAALTVVRAHSTVDPTHVVPGFIRAVGLSPPLERGQVWSFHREEPIPLKGLAKRVAAGLGMGSLRVTGEPDRLVSRVGTMVGGLGQDRHLRSWERHLMGLDPDVIVAGETNDFAQRFAIDSGIALIETCHSASEEPGLQVLAGDLGSRFPDVRVAFHREVVPWVLV
jgi:putative NIF3 family GTP cyclohydrolase 1 type 2